MSEAGPLSGVRVLDLSRVLAGPYCTQMLADHGADVVKVENPEGGDENRLWGTRGPNGISCNFNSVNRGKRSITLNLKSPRAREILDALIRRTDVAIHSFLPATADRLGLDEARILARHPKLVLCTLSGYGAKGPMRDRAGYDLMMQAFSGVMSITGVEDGPPVRAGVSFIDMATGLTAYSGIMTALYRRAIGGIGGKVSVSLLETAVALLGYHAVAWLQAGLVPRKEGSGILHLVPYQAFRCSDGYVLAGATNDAAWRRFAEAMGHGEWGVDPRFATNDQRLTHRETLVSLLEELFRGDTVARWTARLEARGVACSPLQTLEQVLTHPQVLANDMVVRLRDRQGGDLPLLGLPFKISGHHGVNRVLPPKLGQDTEAILRDELGLDDQAVIQLRAEGAI